MKIDEFISKLIEIESEHGNLEVLITDGYEAVGYRGDFVIQLYPDFDQTKYVDIGLGGLKEHEQ